MRYCVTDEIQIMDRIKRNLSQNGKKQPAMENKTKKKEEKWSKASIQRSQTAPLGAEEQQRTKPRKPDAMSIYSAT